MKGVLTAEGRERLKRIQSVLASSELDAIVCMLPSNVLMLCGYWPVIGVSIAVATREGTIAILAPKDEAELAVHSWADRIETYEPGSLQRQLDTIDAMTEPLRQLLGDLGLSGSRIGIEIQPIYDGSSYSATFRAEGCVEALLLRGVPEARPRRPAPQLEQLRLALTPYEVGRVRTACQVLERAFAEARDAIHAGAREPDVATALAGAFERLGLAEPGVTRAGAFAWCMSGSNSAKAGGAFARTTNRRLQAGDLVLVHCNPYIDGYFADVTRTYCLGEPTGQIAEMFQAILEARQAAFSALKPGVRCADIDRAARAVLEGRGLEQYFTHGVGHSVGFSVISAELPPRLNPTSADVLELGCTINIEPAVYVPDLGGIRHCDVATITEDGFELLTPFVCELDELVLGSS